MAKLEESQNPTMEEILQTIRGVIAGEISDTDEEDVLELTEVAEDSPSVPKSADVLDNIDKALKAEESPKAVVPAPEPTPAPAPEPELEPELEAEPIVEEPILEGPVEPEPTEVMSNDSIDDMFAEPAIVTAPAAAVEAPPPPAPPPVVMEPEPEPVVAEAEKPELRGKGLLSEQSATESALALRNLVNTIPRQGPYLRSGTTLEDLVIEALRPYLSDWLDRNLPDLVKRLVENEIRKLVPSDDK